MQDGRKPTIIGFLIIVVSSYIYYLFSYRSFFLVDLFFVMFAAIGWFTFLLGLGELIQPVKQQSTTKSKPSDIKSCLLILIFLFLLVSNYFAILFLSDDRIDNILATQPTKQTIATVVDIDIHYGKTTRTPYAIANYNTDKESITEELPYEYHLSNLGDRFTIKYSVEYPHMIKVLSTLH